MNINGTELSNIVSGSSSRFDIWNRFLKESKSVNLAEVGVWKGDFAKNVLETNSDIEKYFLIDPWQHLDNWNKPWNVADDTFDEIYLEALANTRKYSEKTIVLRGTVADVISQIPDNSLDFVYIDGDHTLRGITIDLLKIYPKIKTNGFIAGDDFLNTPWQHDVQFEPTLVCPFAVYFSEAHDLPIAALPFNQFLIHKDEGSGFEFTDFTGRYGDLSLNALLNYDSQAHK